MSRLKINPLIRLIYIIISRSFLSSKLLVQLSDALRKAAEFRIIKEHKGIHPKHKILDYAGFFNSHLSSDDVVLDVGSSKGELTFKMAKYCRKVIGVEIVKENFDYAVKNNNAANINYIHSDIFKYTPSDKISVVVMSNVLEHLVQRVAMLKYLYQICDKLLIRIPALERDWWPVYLKQNNFEYRLDYTHEIEHTRTEILDELKMANWKVNSCIMNWGEYYLICSK